MKRIVSPEAVVLGATAGHGSRRRSTRWSTRPAQRSLVVPRSSRRPFWFDELVRVRALCAATPSRLASAPSLYFLARAVEEAGAPRLGSTTRKECVPQNHSA